MVEIRVSEIEKKGIDSLLTMAQDEPVKLSKNGEDLAFVLSARDYEKLTHDGNVRDLLTIMDEMAAEAKANRLTQGGLDNILQDIERERDTQTRGV